MLTDVQTPFLRTPLVPLAHVAAAPETRRLVSGGITGLVLLVYHMLSSRVANDAAKNMMILDPAKNTLKK